jgi:tetratricopeptide (TPR) repeat protein
MRISAKTAIRNAEALHMKRKVLAETNFADLRSARRSLREELATEPGHHWILTRIGNTYYQEGKNTLALKYIRKGLEIQPNCPLVLWDYACVLSEVGKEPEALRIFEKLIRRGADRIANDECGEGISWAKSLVLDCYYRGGWSAVSLGKAPLARKYFLLHFQNRERGLFSLYRRADALRKVFEAFPELRQRITK